MSQIRNKVELLLALLAAGEELSELSAKRQSSTRVVGITRLEKLLFLLKMEAELLKGVEDSEDFHFVPFRMGPWSQEVYDEVDFLESLGLLEKRAKGRRSAADTAHDNELFSELMLDKYQKTSSVTDDKAEIFQLTERGMQKAIEIFERLPDEEEKKVISIKRRFNKMNLRQVLRYVYKHYPQYTTDSEIKDYVGA